MQLWVVPYAAKGFAVQVWVVLVCAVCQVDPVLVWDLQAHQQLDEAVMS